MDMDMDDFFDEEEGMNDVRKMKRERIKTLTLAELDKELKKDFPFTSDGIWEEAELLAWQREKWQEAGIQPEYEPLTMGETINPCFPTLTTRPICSIPSPEEARLEGNMLLWTHLYYDREVDYRSEYYDKEKGRL